MPKTEPAKKAAPRKKTAPAASQPHLSDLDTNDWFVGLDDVEDFANVLYYGREGSAKTTGLATMANLGRGKVLVINAEGGLKKIALQKRGINTDNIVIWPNPKKPVPITGANLNALYQKLAADLADDPTSWAGVALDSASDIYVTLLGVAQKKRIGKLRGRGISDVDEEFVDIADYGEMTKVFMDMLRKFRDLPCHFVVTALERRDVDKDTGKPQYGPDVTPGLQKALLGYVDFVIMCKPEDEDGPYRGLTRANSRYRAKDRFDVLPRVMAEPTFERVFGYLHGELTEDEDPLQALITSKAQKAQDKSEDDDETEDDEAEDPYDDESSD